MTQTRYPIGTVKQRATLIFMTSFILFVVWTHRPPLPNSLRLSSLSKSSPHIIITPAHHDVSHIDLSTARAPFIAWPLARLCAEADAAGAFVPGLVFLCDNNSGGPGNMRNYLLTCVRYALEAGATALVSPRLRVRTADAPADLFRGGHAGLDYLFDAAHFAASLTTACPRLALHPTLDAVPHVAAKAAREGLPDADKMVETLRPRALGGRRAGCDARDPNRHTDRFGAAVRAWLAESAVEQGHAPVAVESPRLLRPQWGVLWDWPVGRDGPELAASLGGVLRFRDDVLVLGDAVVRALRGEAGGAGRGSSGAREEAGAGLVRRGFLGIHLRTEEDALKEWPSYDVQASGYLREAGRQGFKGGTAYLASGSDTEIQKFTKHAQEEIDLRVLTKHNLLEGKDLEKLQSLSWDQQALVDFVVLLESDYFLGVSPSSFSINVALKRHLQTGGLYTRPWKVGGSGDGRSWIVGTFESYWDNWLFMYDGMWA
jgi:hypothetical protein